MIRCRASRFGTLCEVGWQLKKPRTGPVPQTLPLKDHEVVLIFDDGPLFRVD